jgi:hypothetical protein
MAMLRERSGGGERRGIDLGGVEVEKVERRGVNT